MAAETAGGSTRQCSHQLRVDISKFVSNLNRRSNSLLYRLQVLDLADSSELAGILAVVGSPLVAEEDTVAECCNPCERKVSSSSANYNDPRVTGFD